MSPTYYAVQTARLNRECEAARKVGDIPGMQRALRGLTNLRRHMYGTPEART
jgi:hypothetical protein